MRFMHIRPVISAAHAGKALCELSAQEWGIETNMRMERWCCRRAKLLNEKEAHKANEAETRSRASD